MNVFVLCAGRTASTALTAACKHINNYSSAHESRVGILSSEKLKYPESHIEIDNRLIWFNQELDFQFGDAALYVHLKRDRVKVASSYEQRWNLNESIVKAFGHGILMKPRIAKSERKQICLDYVDHVERNIELFLSNKPNTLTIETENIKNDFEKLWHFVGAEGDLEKALMEFNVAHNVNKTSWLSKLKNALSS